MRSFASCAWRYSQPRRSDETGCIAPYGDDAARQFSRAGFNAGVSTASARSLVPVPSVAVVAISAIAAVSVLLMLHLIADQVAKPRTAKPTNRCASKR
jgi:hypothetical protein